MWCVGGVGTNCSWKKGCSWEMQCQFVQMLVMSRLLFKAHVWTLRHKDTVLLHRPYMRALRRIAGAGWKSRGVQGETQLPNVVGHSDKNEGRGCGGRNVSLRGAGVDLPECQERRRQAQKHKKVSPNVVGHSGQEVWKCTMRYGGGHARPLLGSTAPRRHESIVGLLRSRDVRAG